MLSLVVSALIVTMVTGVPRDRSRDHREMTSQWRGSFNTQEKGGHKQGHDKSDCASRDYEFLDYRNPQHMYRHFLSNESVVCNDGTRAGYYLRKNENSRRWVIFLEGGWYCFDHASCHRRWLQYRNLMTSQDWPPSRTEEGILSSSREENPYAYDANMVFVPYCSSDSWSGTHKGSKGAEFSFMGALIVENVVRDLVAQHQMDRAARVVLAGTSAGGTGVLVNLDRTADLLARLVPAADVRGIADSGWFLDNEQYEPTPCTDFLTCAPSEGIKRGIDLWKGQVPKNCEATYPGEPWRCYFGYRLYKTLKTPVFVVQNLFDKAQIMVDNVGTPVQTEQWQYIQHIGQDMKRTVTNVSAVFAPACYSHIIITKSEWRQLQINKVTLPEALICWEEGSHERNRYRPTSGTRSPSTEAVERLITGDRRQVMQATNAHVTERRHRKKNRKKKKKKKDRGRKRGGRGRKRNRHHRQSLHVSRARGGSARDRGSGRGRRSLFDEHDLHHVEHHRGGIGGGGCNHHRIDTCVFPQCNFYCPKLRDPYTGKEVRFIELLFMFGLDPPSVANALDTDLPTLKGMDNDLLLSLLIEHGR